METMDVDVDMNPALWGTLPRELVLLVFARLSASGIAQLRLLSKNWKRAIETRSEFSRLLDATLYPSMFALIAWMDCGEHCGRAFDVKSNRWYNFCINAAYDCVITVGASDGGLICFVSETTRKPLVITVMNPLTRKQVELPCLVGMEGVRPTPLPTMAQLIMDRQTQHYKVFVAGYMKKGGRQPFAQVYDSKTKGWTVVGSEQRLWDRIHGCEYKWTKDDAYNSGDRLGPCVYDFADGQLQDFGGSDIVEGAFALTYAFLKNRLFVLQRPSWPADLVPTNASDSPPKYGISEYHLEKHAQAWVKVETHKCNPFNDYSDEDYRFQIHACNGFLMVLADDYETQTKGWLYDLCAHEWRKLPDLLGEHDDNGPVDLMCELRWDAIP